VVQATANFYNNAHTAIQSVTVWVQTNGNILIFTSTGGIAVKQGYISISYNVSSVEGLILTPDQMLFPNT
jgi:hypothetical protein